MTQTYFPFDNGSGANVTEAGWGQMAQFWLGTGVLKGQLNELRPFADSTGMQVKVDTGMAWIQGFYFKSDALVTLPIATAPTSNSRIDVVVLRVDWSANTIALAVLTGTVAASPVAPALTQNSSKWEIALANVAVGTNVSTIAAGNVTDLRTFAGTVPNFYTNQSSQTSYSTANALQQLGISSGITALNGCTIGTNEIVFQKGGKYFFKGRLALSGLNNLQYAELLIRLYQADGVTYSDDTIQILGYQGLGSNYTQNIPIENFILVSVPAGGKVQFFARISEGPRTINTYRLMGFRIGD